jgi:hypothetical protein
MKYKFEVILDYQDDADGALNAAGLAHRRFGNLMQYVTIRNLESGETSVFRVIDGKLQPWISGMRGK